MFSRTKVYGLMPSIIASGYPMATKIIDKEHLDVKDIKRANFLGKADYGSGHDCYLKGIIVQTDVTAPQYWWLQFQRYHFADIISSQSKMHCILKMDIKGQCNELVDERVIEVVNECIEKYNKTNKPNDFRRILSNVPCGFMLTARITTNYLQLKSMYRQRKNHRLREWNTDFVKFVKELPMNDLITKESK